MESTYFIDKKSLNLIKFFKIFNIVLAVCNILIVLLICFSIGTQKYESSKTKKIEDSTSYYSTFDADESEDEKRESQYNSQKTMEVLLILVCGIGYSTLMFMGIELITKHFSNVAESKGLQFEMFKQTEEYSYYIQHLEENKNN